MGRTGRSRRCGVLFLRPEVWDHILAQEADGVEDLRMLGRSNGTEGKNFLNAKGLIDFDKLYALVRGPDTIRVTRSWRGRTRCSAYPLHMASSPPHSMPSETALCTTAPLLSYGCASQPRLLDDQAMAHTPEGLRQRDAAYGFKWRDSHSRQRPQAI